MTAKVYITKTDNVKREHLKTDRRKRFGWIFLQAQREEEQLFISQRVWPHFPRITRGSGLLRKPT